MRQHRPNVSPEAELSRLNSCTHINDVWNQLGNNTNTLQNVSTIITVASIRDYRIVDWTCWRVFLHALAKRGLPYRIHNPNTYTLSVLKLLSSILFSYV
jgi:hypothetical protein